LPFIEGLETFRLDGREMDEYVIAAIVLCQKSETFCFVEPLDCSCRHCSFSLVSVTSIVGYTVDTQVQSTVFRDTSHIFMRFSASGGYSVPLPSFEAAASLLAGFLRLRRRLGLSLGGLAAAVS